jgi:hypothetical protein
MHQLRNVRRPSPAMAVALIALFVALGGSSYAALKVTGKNVKNNSLTSADIRNNSLKSRDVKNRSLRSADFAAGQLPQGPKGDTGPQGPKGDPGATTAVMRTGTAFAVAANDFSSGTASCQPGERATGGGLYNESNVYVLRITSSYPTPNPTTAPSTGNGQTPTGWRVWVANESATPYDKLEVYVICVSP